MAALVRLRPRTVGVIGVAIITLHNLSCVAHQSRPARRALEDPLHRFLQRAGGGYAADRALLDHSVDWRDGGGYWFGTVLTLEPARRNRICVRLGLGALAPFLVLRGFKPVRRSAPVELRDAMPALLSFLNTTKYPASLSFLLMTLGQRSPDPIIGSRTWARRAVADGVRPGAVLLLCAAHPLIHHWRWWSRRSDGTVTRGCSPTPDGKSAPPDGYTWSLGLLYLVWAIAS